MPETAGEELGRLRHELEGLERRLAPPSPPLDLRTLEIAKSKIEKLLKRIKELEEQGAAG